MKDIIFPITYKTDNRGLKDAENGLTKLGNFAGKVGLIAAAGLAVAAAGAVAFGIQSLKAAAEAEGIARGLENAAKNAGVFGERAESKSAATKVLDDQSRALGELTGIDDELINQLKTGWLSVPDLANKGTDAINELAVRAADIAKGTGKDISGVALAFTKITGDSETALSKLNRLGIIISDQQKITYDDILATSGEIAAQDYLLQQLGEKYEGAAAAAANPFERVDVIFGNLKETIGTALLPAFEGLIPILQDFIEQLVSDPEFQIFLDTMSQTLSDMLPRLIPVAEQFGDLMIRLLPGLNPLLDIMSGLVGTLSGALGFLHEDNEDIFKDFKNIAFIIETLNQGIEDLNGFIDDLTIDLGGFGPAAEGIFRGIVAALTPLQTGLQNIVNLIKFIQGSPVETNQSPYNYDGSPNLDGIPSTLMAAGGIVMPRPGGMLATIGEAGQAEAVIPLDRLGSIMGGGGGSTYNITVTAGMGADGAQIGEQIVTAIRKYERTSGKVFAAA